MSWPSLIKAGLLALVALVSWAKRREAIDAATAEILARQLQGALNEIERARTARESVSNDPDRLHDDDGFKRD